MVSEKITFYRTNEDKTEVIEQLPKTVSSQVYDSDNEQFLDETISDIRNEMDDKINVLNQKRDKNVKIKNTDLEISTDEDKIKLINLSDEVRQAMTGNTPVNTVLEDGIVVREKIATNAVTAEKLEIIEKSPQLYDYDNDSFLSNTRVNSSDGTLFETTNMQTTNFIEIEPNRTIVFAVGSIASTSSYLNNTALYDANKNFIVGYGTTVQTIVTPSNARYIRKTTIGTIRNLGIFYDVASTDFSFWRKIKSSVVAEQANHAKNADNATTATTATTALTANVALRAESVKDIAKVLSKQKFDVSTVLTNSRLNGSAQNGLATPSSGYATSDFIEIEEGTNTIVIAKSNISGSMNFNNIAYYDVNKAYISGFNTGNANFATLDEYGRLNLTPPQNAKYLRYCVQGVYQRLGVFFNTYSNNFNYYAYYEFDKSKWANKKIVGYGDSLVAGASNTTTTWLAMVAKQLGFEPVNRGIGGSTVLQSDTSRVAWVADGTTDKSLGEYGEYVSRPTGLDDGSGATTGTTQPVGTVEITSSMCTDARVNTIPTNADAIIILAGTNGMDEASYRLMLQKIYTRCPQAMVFCCSLPFRYSDDARTQIVDVSANNTIIKNLCQEFGSHYIDLKGMEGVNHYNKTFYLSDNVHATTAGNERRAQAITSVLKTKEPLT